MRSLRGNVGKVLSTALITAFLPARTRKTTDKREVFEHYFGTPPPPYSDIHRASYQATHRVGLDEEELILDANLPGTFMVSVLPPSVDAPLVPPEKISSELYGGGNPGRIDAFSDAPPWFRPPDRTSFSVVQPGSDFWVITFTDETNSRRFQILHTLNIRGRVFLDRADGHVYVRYSMP